MAKTLSVGKKHLTPEASLSPQARAHQRATELEARCPFCRDEIQVEAIGWTCCSLCLSRHHSECWREHGSCASCGGDQNLTFVTVREDLRRRRGTGPAPAARPSWRRRLLIWLGAPVLGIVAFQLLWLGYYLTNHMPWYP
mgnify:CR=1 FL=1